MTFTVAGLIITQANETGIAITAAASITGGVRFTCTQSYAVGNVVRITGTTNYNGNWIVAAVTGTTFDVLESAQGTAITFVSSQTGTAARGDASLAGISGLAGVTTTTLDASSGFVIYTLADNVKLQIDGTLIIGGARETNTILGANEMLVLGKNAQGSVQPDLLVRNNGVLVVGRRYTNTVDFPGTTAPQYTDGVQPQVLIYQKGQYGRNWIEGAAFGLTATDARAFFSVAQGGRFDWLGGTIDLWGGIGWTNTSIINIGFAGVAQKPTLDYRRSGNNIYQYSTSLTCNGLVIIGDRGINIGAAGTQAGRGPALFLLAAPLTFKGYEPRYMTVAIGGSSTAAGGNITIEDYPGAKGTFLDANKECQAGATLNLTFKNSTVGTSIAFLDGGSGICRLYITQTFTATVRTTAAAAIQDAVVWLIANNAVQSVGTTNASGLATIDNIETGFADDNIAVLTLRFATGDVATAYVKTYESLAATFSVTLRGIGGTSQTFTMLSDTNVTLSRTSAAALTTIANLDNLYDAAKYWSTLSANRNYPSATTHVVTPVGTTIDFGSLNVLIDAAAANAFAVNTGTGLVTIKTSTLAVGSKFTLLKTTGTISFANGAVATCGLQGTVIRSITGTYSPVLVNATVQFSTAGSYDLTGANITGPITLTNSSGGNVTVQLSAGVTFVNTGPNITVLNPAFATFEVTNIIPNSRLFVYNETQTNEIYNAIVTTTSWSLNQYIGQDFNNGDIVLIRLVYLTGVTAKSGFEVRAEVNDGFSIFAEQTDDVIYNAIGLDGSTITEFSADYPNIQIDLNDPDYETTVHRLYAWWVYNLYSANGIYYWFGGLIAEDIANFKVITNILDLQLDNIASTAVNFTGGIRLYRDDGSSPVVTATTGGGSIILYADKVYVVNDPTPTEIADTILRRSTANIESSTQGDPLTLKSLYGMIAQGVHNTQVSGATLTVTKSDDVTTLGTRTVTTNSEALPIVGIDSD